MFVSLLSIFVAIAADVVNSLPSDLAYYHGRIIGGRNASIKEIPYQVALETVGNELHCGGIIISQTHVLTAAHCKGPMIHVRSGSSFTGRGGSIHKVKKFIIPSGYNSPRANLSYDIGVIKVDPPFPLDATRQPIQLFRVGEKSIPGQNATVSGWGTTKTSEISEQLQVVDVLIVDRGICNESYQSRVTEDQICAGLMSTGGKDSCQGDSGGPLVINGRLAGIVSSGIGCALPGFPGRYTAVAFYHDWIEKHKNTASPCRATVALIIVFCLLAYLN